MPAANSIKQEIIVSFNVTEIELNQRTRELKRALEPWSPISFPVQQIKFKNPSYMGV